jgi:hypothetical protein
VYAILWLRREQSRTRSLKETCEKGVAEPTP